MKKVLFVSKPIVPPWHDGSKNFVRDVASHLMRTNAVVMSVPGAGKVGDRVVTEPVYREGGTFAPGLVANARVAWRLFTGEPHDLWHFVFAPSPRTTKIAKMAIERRRKKGWNGKVVQSIASAPKVFDASLLFGDVAVTMSEHTRQKFLAAGVDAKKILTIPPCAPAPTAATRDEERALRKQLDLGDGPIVTFPGDYEVSTGAETVANAARAILAAKPNARIVFACRPKTPKSKEAQAKIVGILEASGVAAAVRHVGELPSLAPLLSISKAILFPVDDLYGKVDLPLVLLEALALGVPLVLAKGGPLEEIEAARYVEPANAEALAAAAIALLDNPGDLPSKSRVRYMQMYRPVIVARHFDDLYAALGA
ncbi:MAG TPA: glycosyltransferase [Polyangiaceae bacterium]